VPQVVGAGAERPGGDDDGGALAEEPREAAAPGHRSEGPEGGPLAALPAGERGARRALAQVRAELRALGPGEGLVQLLRDRQLGLRAREGALELFAQGAPRPEDERLDGAHGETEHLGDLRVRPAFDLPEDDGRTLVEGEMAERPADVVRRRPVVVDELVGDVVVELHLLRPPRLGAEALQADVVRDLDQPVERRARVLTALERAVGVEERRLRDVLRVGAVAQHPVRVPVDVRGVAPVEALEGMVQTRTGRHAH